MVHAPDKESFGRRKAKPGPSPLRAGKPAKVRHVGMFMPALWGIWANDIPSFETTTGRVFEKQDVP